MVTCVSAPQADWGPIAILIAGAGGVKLSVATAFFGVNASPLTQYREAVGAGSSGLHSPPPPVTLIVYRREVRGATMFRNRST
jgi:hypothetical protein